jgi:hypothetical protein
MKMRFEPWWKILREMTFNYVFLNEKKYKHGRQETLYSMVGCLKIQVL